jgi:hypothetical protein
MKKKIDFLWNKINKCKSEKNRVILQSIYNDEIVLQGFREHITLMRTQPRIIERKKENGDIAFNMSVSYSVFSKQMEEELKHKIILWLVENLDKEEIDYWYSQKEKLQNGD